MRERKCVWLVANGNRISPLAPENVSVISNTASVLTDRGVQALR